MTRITLKGEGVSKRFKDYGYLIAIPTDHVTLKMIFPDRLSSLQAYPRDTNIKLFMPDIKIEECIDIEFLTAVSRSCDYNYFVYVLPNRYSQAKVRMRIGTGSIFAPTKGYLENARDTIIDELLRG